MTTTETMTVQHLPNTASSQDISEVIDRDGVVIVDDFVDPELLAKLNRELDPVLNGMEPAEGYADMNLADFWGKKTKRVTGLAEFSDAFVSLLLDETILGVADLRLLPNCADYVLSTGMAIQIGPGEPQQLLHPDDAAWPALVGPDAAETVMFTMIACNDFTEENGATRVIPGSHKWQPSQKPMLNPEITELESVPAEMSAGSVCFMSSKTVHGGGANITTDNARRGVFLGYILGWLRGEEAVPLAMTPDRLRQLPERARYLLGWGGVGSRLDGSFPMQWAYKMGDGINVFECGQ